MPRYPINKPPRGPLLLRESPEGGTDVATETGGNNAEVTVSELSAALKRTVEDRFGFVRLRGEVSNYRGPHASGHAYFSLKDEGARIDAVIWKTTFARFRIKPEEGMDVVASGKITTFPGKSSYQIVVESLEPAGIGALMALLEERRLRLAAEGLFDAARKRALPFLPRVIGVITSPTGAVIRDILHRVAARFPRHVVVWPVRVQGDTSAAEVAAAIAGFNAHDAGSPFLKPELIIVARGGGSLEDLWSFNDEAVVRAVAAGLIPLISAVGHETDWTLIDHVADLRAPTPTGAAELALPVQADLVAAIERLHGRQASATMRRLERAQSDLRSLLRLLPTGPDILAGPRQRQDRAAAQLPAALRANHDRARMTLLRMGQRLRAQSPQVRMARASQRLSDLGLRLHRAPGAIRERQAFRTGRAAERLAAAFASRLRLLGKEQEHQRKRLEQLAQRLQRVSRAAPARSAERLRSLQQMMVALGYRSVLARGYAIIRTPDGVPLRSADAVQKAGRFAIELADGHVAAQTADTPPPPVDPKEPSRKAKARPREIHQANLFEFAAQDYSDNELPRESPAETKDPS